MLLSCYTPTKGAQECVRVLSVSCHLVCVSVCVVCVSMQALITSYRPMALPVSTVQLSLGFDTYEDALLFCQANELVIEGSGSDAFINTRMSLSSVAGPPKPLEARTVA